MRVYDGGGGDLVDGCLSRLVGCERLLMASARAPGPEWSCMCRWWCRYCVGSKDRHAREMTLEKSSGEGGGGGTYSSLRDTHHCVL